jgi:hypothetical protein
MFLYACGLFMNRAPGVNLDDLGALMKSDNDSGFTSRLIPGSSIATFVLRPFYTLSLVRGFVSMTHATEPALIQASTRRLPVFIAALTLSAGLCTGVAGAQDLNDEGWTVIEPSVDTRFVFVSSSEGNDLNSGFTPSVPVKTLERAEELVREGYPDWILLKRGDQWSDGFGVWGTSGRSAEERVVISSYGEGEERPRIVMRNEGFIAGRINDEVSHVAIMGLEIVADRDAGDTSSGIRWLSTGENLLIEDCLIDGFKDNVVVQAVGGSFSGVAIRRNVIVDSWSASGHSQGIFVRGGDGVLIEENIIDHNGWNPDITGANASMFNQNVYLQTDTYGVEFHGNLTSRASAAGVQIRAGGNASQNLLYSNALGMRFGYDELEWPSQAASGSVIQNVVIGGELADPGLTGAGVGFWIERVDNTLVRDNIVANYVEGSVPRAFTLNGFAGDVVFDGNIAFDFVDGQGRGHALKASAQVEGSALFQNNRWSMPGSNRVINLRYSENMTFLGNDLHGFDESDDVFFVDGARKDYNEWVDLGFVSDDSISPSLELPSAGRDLDDYAQYLGYSDAEDMIEAARQMDRSHWDVRLTGRAAANWIRLGYISQD